MKHQTAIAIMVLVHKNENQVNKLIKYLSDDFDIYVHIDKRSKIKITNKDNVFVFKKYKPYWGSFNIVLSTLLLLREAYKRKYERYILLSGQDIPIKTNKQIKEYFLNNHFEYITNDKLPLLCWGGNGGFDRISKYYPNGTNPNKKQIFLYCINLFRKLTDDCEDYEYFGGSQWFNLTYNCVKKMLEYMKKDKKYLRRFLWTSCSDELFFQTLIHVINDVNIVNDDLRYIDWETGPEYPRILRITDYENLLKSEKLFARKFDETIDNSIIEKMYERTITQ
jgi:hypothetical protein